MPVESKEKRQRSLLECLDQNYFSESPNKIKRETIRSDIASTSTAGLTDKNPNASCCIDIDNMTASNESTEANENIQKLHIAEQPDDTA